jgi:integrase
MPARRDREGRWRYRKIVKLPDGGRIRISGSPTLNTKQAAEVAEREHIIRVLSPSPAGQTKKEVPTFQKFVDEVWWSTYPSSVGNRPSTVEEKEIHLRLHLKPTLGRLTLDKIRGEVVGKLVSRLRDESKLKPKTLKNILGTLRRILASAVEWEYLAALPVLPRMKVPQPEWDFLTPEEAQKVLQAAGTRSEEVEVSILFALHTGARAGEQLALQWGDVDFGSRLVVFRRSSTRGVVGPTKSGRERRVPLSASLEAALKRIRHLRSKLVFCNPDGSAMKIDQLHERLWGACRRAGIREVRWHDLRHSFASHLAMRGVPIPQIQQWMGHSTITMTMRYAHLSPGSGANLIRALDAPAVANPWQKTENQG